MHSHHLQHNSTIIKQKQQQLSDEDGTVTVTVASFTEFFSTVQNLLVLSAKPRLAFAKQYDVQSKICVAFCVIAIHPNPQITV